MRRVPAAVSAGVVPPYVSRSPLGPRGETAVALLSPLLAVAIGAWVYLDARRTGREELAPLLAVAVGGLLLAGTLPGLVAFAVAEDPATQGFPTSLRVLPGFVALAVYLYLR